MMKFYRASKTHHKAGEILGLLDYMPIESCFGVKDMISEEENDIFIRQQFPNGLSNHGKVHLYRYNNMDGHKGYISAIHGIETTFEMYRQLKYPNWPSRFQSYFACETKTMLTNLVRNIKMNLA